MLLDFPDTLFGNCAPHKLPLSQKISNNITLFINKIIHIILLSLLIIYTIKNIIFMKLQP
jgi:hypothetical protein